MALIANDAAIDGVAFRKIFGGAQDDAKAERATMDMMDVADATPSPPMQFILLDVDGVLHPLTQSGHPLHALMDDLTRRTDADMELNEETGVGGVVAGEFLSDNMTALAHMINSTGAQIILSSTWRETGPQRRAVDAQLVKHGLQPAVGATPRIPGLTGGRSKEILAWADTATENCCWVAIDDLELQGLPNDCFVKTEPSKGLTLADAERAVECLRRQQQRLASSTIKVAQPASKKVARKPTNDLNEPAVSCFKTTQIEVKRPPPQPKRTLQLQLDDGTMEDAPPKPAIARITLNDCLACSGCVTKAEAAFVTQQNTAEFLQRLQAGKDQLVVVSVSTAAWGGLGVHYQLGLRETFRRLSSLFKSLGCHHVFDCDLANDLHLAQVAAEFVERFRTTQAASSAGGGAAASAPLPLLTASCPGWVQYAERKQGAYVLPHLSRVRSPQQIAGVLIKRLHATAAGVPPDRVYHVAVAPSFDQKLEATRAAFADGDTKDVDCVLTPLELAALLDERGVASLSHIPDDGTAEAAETPLSKRYASGGAAEFVFRVAARELFGVELPPEAPLPWTAGRNQDHRELLLPAADGGGVPRLRFAQAYGFRNIQNVLRRVKSGRQQYDLVEMMASPGGEANGGGQARAPNAEAQRTRAAEIDALLANDAETAHRSPLDSPKLTELYAPGGFLEGGPLGARRSSTCGPSTRRATAAARQRVVV